MPDAVSTRNTGFWAMHALRARLARFLPDWHTHRTPAADPVGTSCYLVVLAVHVTSSISRPLQPARSLWGICSTVSSNHSLRRFYGFHSLQPVCLVTPAFRPFVVLLSARLAPVNTTPLHGPDVQNPSAGLWPHPTSSWLPLRIGSRPIRTMAGKEMGHHSKSARQRC